MRKVARWTLIGAGSVAAVVVLAAGVLYIKGSVRLNRTYDIAVDAIRTGSPVDSAISRGRHLAEAVTLCQACHGETLAGQAIVDEPGIATIYASNLTSGRGGTGSRYTDADYVRAIRHGVNPDGRGLMIMHSDAYNNLTETDLAGLIAYVKSVAPVDNEVPPVRAAILGRIFVGLGLFDMESMPLIPAEVIDHARPVPAGPLPAVSVEYGRYLVSIAMCRLCHGPDLAGGPPIEEGAPPSPNIAVYGQPGGWSDEQFMNTLRSGVTPYGKTLNGEAMPWEVYRRMTDDELMAVWSYVKTVGEDG